MIVPLCPVLLSVSFAKNGFYQTFSMRQSHKIKHSDWMLQVTCLVLTNQIKYFKAE